MPSPMHPFAIDARTISPPRKEKPLQRRRLLALAATAAVLAGACSPAASTPSASQGQDPQVENSATAESTPEPEAASTPEPEAAVQADSPADADRNSSSADDDTESSIEPAEVAEASDSAGQEAPTTGGDAPTENTGADETPQCTGDDKENDALGRLVINLRSQGLNDSADQLASFQTEIAAGTAEPATLAGLTTLLQTIAGSDLDPGCLSIVDDALARITYRPSGAEVASGPSLRSVLISDHGLDNETATCVEANLPTATTSPSEADLLLAMSQCLNTSS